MQEQNTTTHPKTNGGRFRKAADPRRHKFTREECQAGFWAAVESICERYPDAVTSCGAHMSTKFLPALTARRATRRKESLT